MTRIGLGVFRIDEEQVLPWCRRSSKGQGAVGALQAEEAAFPQAERAEHGAAKITGIQPGAVSVQPLWHRRETTATMAKDEGFDQQADTAGADQILLHTVEGLRADGASRSPRPFAEDVDLLGGDAAGFQFKASRRFSARVEVVADVVMPVHGMPPIESDGLSVPWANRQEIRHPLSVNPGAPGKRQVGRD
ncbi:hypothetical protein P4110_10250 [Pseudomonas aeruginosa]|nr:hypothetical protein [Pseudomonas aeruginosa]